MQRPPRIFSTQEKQILIKIKHHPSPSANLRDSTHGFLMTTGRSKWQTFSRATIFFMLSLLTIFAVRLLFDPPLLADEFSVNTAEQPPDFEGMKLKAGVELNQELDKCHKLKPEECQKCKEEAGKRWRIEVDRINQQAGDWALKRNAKKSTPPAQHPTPQPTPSTQQPTQPTPQVNNQLSRLLRPNSQLNRLPRPNNQLNQRLRLNSPRSQRLRLNNQLSHRTRLQ